MVENKVHLLVNNGPHRNYTDNNSGKTISSHFWSDLMNDKKTDGQTKYNQAQVFSVVLKDRRLSSDSSCFTSLFTEHSLSSVDAHILNHYTNCYGYCSCCEWPVKHVCKRTVHMRLTLLHQVLL